MTETPKSMFAQADIAGYAQSQLDNLHGLQNAAQIQPEAPTATGLLTKAAAIMTERGKTYDSPEGERSMGKTVAAFNAITGFGLTESEGWLLMLLLKQVRLFTREEYHADSAEDTIAYAALLAEAKGATT